MGSGNLRADDRFIVRVSSDVYGDDEHGPYKSLDEAREARARLKLAADVLNDRVDRHYEIIVHTNAECHCDGTVDDPAQGVCPQHGKAVEGSIAYFNKPECPVIAEPSREPIVITVEGGVIQSINNIPPGQVVQVWDFDTEYADDEDELRENEQGERFYLSEYVGSRK